MKISNKAYFVKDLGPSKNWFKGTKLFRLDFPATINDLGFLSATPFIIVAYTENAKEWDKKAEQQYIKEIENDDDYDPFLFGKPSFWKDIGPEFTIFAADWRVSRALAGRTFKDYSLDGGWVELGERIHGKYSEENIEKALRKLEIGYIWDRDGDWTKAEEFDEKDLIFK